jgi:hypothetical protein
VRRTGLRRAALAVTFTALATLSSAGVVPGARTHSANAAVEDPTPTFAYYYIWYNASSWNRGKTDYPLVGRYSSDDADVMAQQIDEAKQAGIRGFIVSWKRRSTPDQPLSERLQALVRIADEKDFKLALIYEGLDFHRNPLPVEKVESDLRYFAIRYADDRAFDFYPKPMVIWGGTWEFTTAEIRRVTEPLRNKLMILASEKSPGDYLRVAPLVDGNAYYWSSVNPDTFPDYQGKLTAMGQSVHSYGGLWVAPVAPGFDARGVGGTTVVDRKEGETLRIEYDTAIRSEPDMIGLISWNEYSENSHVEPSRNYGYRYLEVLADILHAPAPQFPDWDSSGPQGHTKGTMAYFSIGLLLALLIGSIVLIGRRRGGGGGSWPRRGGDDGGADEDLDNVRAEEENYA